MYRASVIIPVYNAEKTLVRCVESILYGRERNVELLLIDDCSGDESWALCQSLAQQHENVRAFRNETNRGVSYTRNRGLDEATGEYILFVDSDDWVSDSFVEDLYSEIKGSPGALVMCAYKQINDKSCQNTKTILCSAERRVSEIKQEDLFQLLDLELIHYVWNKIFVSSIVREAGIRFDENQFMGEDFQFVLDYYQAIAATRCVVINRPNYSYARYFPNSLNSRWSEIGNLDQGIKRLWKLAQITGKRDLGEQKVWEFKQSFVYHISRDMRLTIAQRIHNIETVMQDGKAIQHYTHQRWIRMKEHVAVFLKGLAK